jgi:uncharacterized SAM-binding protein YcdF (DUF218 family)
MFFVASKVIGFFSYPSNCLFVLALIGALMLPTRFARAGRRCLVAAVVLLALFGLLPIGNLLIYPLEQRFPAWDASRGTPDGMIILGGALNPDISVIHGEASLNEAAERVTAVASLARRFPNARIIYSGGNASLVTDVESEATFAIPILESFGIPSKRIAIEDRSRNTVENARFTKALIDPKPGERWLLVTSAHHMPRAIGVFRKIDFRVEPYPVDWRVGRKSDLVVPFSLVSDGLKRSDTAVHEWVGLVVYWLTGRTSELFPAPR